jgi:hypothetical protein
MKKANDETKRILKLAIQKYLEWLDTHKELAVQETRFFIAQSHLVKGYNKNVVDKIYQEYFELKQLWYKEGFEKGLISIKAQKCSIHDKIGWLQCGDCIRDAINYEKQKIKNFLHKAYKSRWTSSKIFLEAEKEFDVTFQ